MWRCRDRRSGIRFGCGIRGAEGSCRLAEFFQFLVQVRVSDRDLGSDGLVSAEFEEGWDVDGTGRVEEEADDLDEVAGVVFEEGAADGAQLVGSGAPVGAGIQNHFDAFEGIGFIFGLGIGVPRGCVLAAAKQALEGGGAAEFGVDDDG